VRGSSGCQPHGTHESRSTRFPGSRIPHGISEAELGAQLNEIHDRGGLALLAFDGQNNTFDPGSDVKQAAENTVSLIQKYGFDGVDLDLEQISVDTNYLKTYIQEMRSRFSDILLTCAPQIAGGYGGPASFAQSTFSPRIFLSRQTSMQFWFKSTTNMAVRYSMVNKIPIQASFPPVLVRFTRLFPVKAKS
jgi:hypothetical protein